MEQCKSFRKYKGLREPKCGCRCCWDMFFAKHPLWLSWDMKQDFKALEMLRGTVYIKQMKRFIARYA